MSQHPLKIAIVAGESSGDNLGSDLIKSLQARYPDAQFKGIAGPKMQALGCESWYPMEQLAVIGVWAILKQLPKFLAMRKQLAKQIVDWQADVFIGIDAPEFNLGLEGMLKEQGIRTVHYVSPSVWAWRKKRIHKIKKNVDLMLCLFPFEEQIYHDHKIPVCCVGHPLADQFVMDPDQAEPLERLGLTPYDQMIAVLPGSRMSEIEHLGHLFLEVIAELQHETPSLKAMVACANERIKEEMHILAQGMEQPPVVEYRLDQARDIMQSASVILVASGTASLEAMLSKRPTIVAYKVSALSYAIYSRLVKLDYFSLPNLLAGVKIIPEFIQSDADVHKITDEVKLALRYGMTPQLKKDFDNIHSALQLGGSEKAAEAIASQFFETEAS
jgi:lipid-A-disaccharide synthase